jgi:hypothetical protein
MLIDVNVTSMMPHEICLMMEFVDLFDPNSQRSITEVLSPISSHGERKLFSPTLLAVVKRRPFSHYIYT